MSAEQQDTGDAPVLIHLVYRGRRFDSKAKIAHAWQNLDDPSDQRVYGKVAGRVVGGIYTVEQVPGETSVYGNTIAYTGDQWQEDRDEVARWLVKDQETLRQDQLRRAEGSLAKRTDLDRALEPLEALARTLRTRHDVAALQSLVNERLVAAYYTRGK